MNKNNFLKEWNAFQLVSRMQLHIYIINSKRIAIRELQNNRKLFKKYAERNNFRNIFLGLKNGIQIMQSFAF